MEPVKGFRGEFFFLSNFYEADFWLAGSRYITAEHAFQCMKTDLNHRARIQMATTAAEAKKIGRYVPLRSDWENVKLDIMRLIVFEKFNQNTDILGKLINTKTRLLFEVNTWGDIYWGVGRDGAGLNHLGKILMDVRNEFRTLVLPQDTVPHPYSPEVEKIIF